MLRGLVAYILAFSTLMASYFFEPWWRYLAATMVIVLVVRLLLPAEYRDELGLRIPLGHGVVALFAFAITAFATRVLTLHIGASPEIAHVHHEVERYHVALSLSQALNQELVLRAMLLNPLRRKLQNDLALSIGVSLALAVGHFGFYAYVDDAMLKGTVLATLLVFNLIGNHLFLFFGHLAFALALHCGWNLIKFAAVYVPVASATALDEAAGFNLVEGSLLTLGSSIALLGAILIALRPQSWRQIGPRPAPRG